MARTETPLSAAAAAAALNDLEYHEERLPPRVGGIICMVFGIALAGLFVTYGLARAALPSNLHWFMTVLWAPWIAAALTVTNVLRSSQALASGRRWSPGRHWAWGAAFSLLFAGLLFATGHVFPLRMFPLIGVVLGVFTVLLAWLPSSQGGRRAGAVPRTLAGVVIFATAICLAALKTPDAGAAAILAAVSGMTYIAAGLTAFVRG